MNKLEETGSIWMKVNCNEMDLAIVYERQRDHSTNLESIQHVGVRAEFCGTSKS